jgi:hypothetical protein
MLFLMLLAAATAQPTLAAKDEKQICAIQPTTGSRLRAARMCMTATEWQRYKRDLRDTTDRVQSGKLWKCMPPQC